jgi:hypothetical protein
MLFNYFKALFKLCSTKLLLHVVTKLLKITRCNVDHLLLGQIFSWLVHISHCFWQFNGSARPCLVLNAVILLCWLIFFVWSA